MTDSTPENARPRPLVLAILDGFGEREERDANAVRLAQTPHLDALAQGHLHTLIGTSGPDVGLPPGQMGNSEVGHLNFGAGRIALMDISKIDVAIAERKLDKNPVIQRAITRALHDKCRLHLFGLVSDGGVHSSLEHLLSLIDVAAASGVKVVVHAFLDGRDTPPKSAGSYLRKLEAHLEGKGVIGTVSGRYYAMDRDKRWDRVHKAYSAIVRGKAPSAKTALEALSASYERGVTDEFVEPVCIGGYAGIVGETSYDAKSNPPLGAWKGKEVGFAFNFRPDRMRELSAMLVRRNLPPEVEELLTTEALNSVPNPIVAGDTPEAASKTASKGHPIIAFDDDRYSIMTEYDAALGLSVAFPKDDVKDSFGEVIARAGLKQLRCAETEKYAHVTYFFSGGREAPFEGEDRKLVPSPRDVATYDQKPEMSAELVASEVQAAIESGKYDFILVNFANPDMVGHTGNLEAAIKAVEAVDVGIGAIMAALRKAGGALILTSDHGNCEQMKDPAGHPHTAHTTNPVPLYYANFATGDVDVTLKSGGRICDVAPTMLTILGLPKPQAMTGVSLLAKR